MRQQILPYGVERPVIPKGGIHPDLFQPVEAPC